MKFRWKRFWLGMDMLLCVWIAAVFWLAFQGHADWWWPGWAVICLYAVVRYAMAAVDHFRSWRLWALFDFAVMAVTGVMALVADVGNAWGLWAVILLVTHLAFVKWRGRRLPRLESPDP